MKRTLQEMKKKKYLIVIVAVIFAMAIFATCILFFMSKKKADTDIELIVENPTSDEMESYQMTELPEYERLNKELYVEDKTNSFTDKDLNNYSQEAVALLEDFLKETYTFNGENPEYINRLLTYFVDFEKYPKANHSLCSDIYATFLNENVKSDYRSIEPVAYAILDMDENRHVSILIGGVNVQFETKTLERKDYIITFKATFLYEGGQYHLQSCDFYNLMGNDMYWYWLNDKRGNLEYHGTIYANMEIQTTQTIDRLDYGEE